MNIQHCPHRADRYTPELQRWLDDAADDWLALVTAYGWLHGDLARIPERYHADGKRTAETILRQHGWNVWTLQEGWTAGHRNGVLDGGQLTERFRHPECAAAGNDAKRSSKRGKRARAATPFGESASVGDWKPAPRIGRDIAETFSDAPRPEVLFA